MKPSPPPSWVPGHGVAVVLVCSLSILLHCWGWGGDQEPLWLSLPWQVWHLQGSRERCLLWAPTRNVLLAPSSHFSFQDHLQLPGQSAGDVHISLGAHGRGEPSVSGNTFNPPQALDFGWMAKQGEGPLENGCWCLPSPPWSIRGQKHLVGTREERSFPEPWAHPGGLVAGLGEVLWPFPSS